MTWRTLLGLVAIGILACATPPIADRDWALAALGDESDPVGAGGKPVTLRLDSATSRASGFAGCNRFSGSYELGSERLSFGPMVSTKMFCADAMPVEDEYLAALSAVSTWELAGGVLTLRSAQGAALRFRAAGP